MEAKVPPGLSQRRRPAFDFHVRRVDLAEDLPSAAHPGLRQTIHADLRGPLEETRIPRIDEPFALEAFQRTWEVAAGEPGGLRGPRLGGVASRFAVVP